MIKAGKKKKPDTQMSSGSTHQPEMAAGDGGRDGEEFPVEKEEAELEQRNGETEGEAEEDDEKAGEEEEKEDDDVDGEAEPEKPKLAEGFYEIEAIRKKRVRKGKPQYLIKWRGWPEDANTWEPLKNLLYCSDVVDAFEERLRTRKKRSKRGRKPKHGTAPPQIQEEQVNVPATALTYNVPAVKVRIVERPLPNHNIQETITAPLVDSNIGGSDNVETGKSLPEDGYSMPAVKVRIVREILPSDPLQDSSTENLGDGNIGSVGGSNDVEMAKLPLKDGLGPGSSEEKAGQSDLNGKPSEIEGPIIRNVENIDQIEDELRGIELGTDGHANGILKIDGAELGECSGAKRRKVGCVKKFKLESFSCVTDEACEAKWLLSELQETGNDESTEKGLDNKDKVDTNNVSSITEIVKPLCYSAADATHNQEMTVSFLAKRSNGSYIMVDNKFLKANYPLLLIDFYEQNLNRTPV